MECREWIDKNYRGVYTFSFDSDKRELTASHKPEGRNYLFGRNVAKWIVVWDKARTAVFYGIEADDWTAPVKVLSLNFGEVAMFAYSIGGATEGDLLKSKIDRRCRRLD